DPHSGQPGFKSTPARVERLVAAWRGFLVARSVPEGINVLYATRARLPQGWLVEFAGEGDVMAFAKSLLPRGERIEVTDAARGSARIAILNGGRLMAAFFAARDGGLPDRAWLIAQLGAGEAPSSVELLAGRPATPPPDRGAIV